MREKVAIVALMVALVAGCEKSNDPAGDIQSINLTVGSAWTYQWNLEQRSSTGELLWDTTSQFIVFVSAIGQSVGPYQNLALMEARDRDHPSGTSEVWYSQTSSRLSEVAYRSAGNTPIVLPKKIAAVQASGYSPMAFSPFMEPFALRHISRDSFLADSVHVRDDPRVVYVFPLTTGTSWLSFSAPFLEQRTVSSYEDIAVPAGRFHTASITTTLPTVAPRAVWIDFVSSEGLVKRIFDSWVPMVDQANPAGVDDSVRITETMVLVAH
jgi:hypothetical protein